MPKTELEFEGLKALGERLARFEAEDRRRALRVFDSLEGVLLRTKDGHELVDFSGNDYLGLANHPSLLNAAKNALERGEGSTTSSRLIRGSFSPQEVLENALCDFLQCPKALVYNSGYQANLGLLSALIQRHDAVLMDRLCHASLLDGVQLSGAKARRYGHADYEQLKTMLRDTPETVTKWIISETVFSMDGDCADLKRLLELSQCYGAWLILDDAHGVGVYGNTRCSGLWETLGLLAWPDNVILVGTFSKALGSFGAYVAAQPEVIDCLINQSRSFIYSTALPLSVIAANQASIDLVQADKSHRERLWGNIQLASSLLNRPLHSAILPMVIGDNAETMLVTQALWNAGYFVQGIRPPTVPEGTSRLRITLSAQHTKSQIEGLFEQLQPYLSQVQG